MSEMIRLHLIFESIRRDGLIFQTGATGIIDQNVQAFLALQNFRCKFADGRQWSEVQLSGHHVSITRLGDYFVYLKRNKLGQ